MRPLCPSIVGEMSPIVQPFAAPSLNVQGRRLERVPLCGSVRSSPHSRNPPRKALSLLPARDCGGSASSFLTLPPPITVSSGSSAAMRRPGQVAEFHGLHDAIHDHGRSNPRSEAQKEHLAAVVAAQSLHGGVVDDLHRTTECGCEIEPDPSASQVVWFSNRPAVENRARIADRHYVIRPTPGELLDS
jgi:hypothetical protein